MNKLNKVSFLSLADTNILKGLALILLLIHHLFSKNTGEFNEITIAGHDIVATVAQLSNICVAIFVLLSGYGLTRKKEISGEESLAGFYKGRYVKLLFNFWFIWILFVSVELLMGGRSFVDVYHDHIVGRAILDFFGLSYLFGFYGYNPTWWFMSLIIILYALYPLKYKLAKKDSTFLLLVSAVVSLIPFATIGYMQCYLFSFSCGIVMAIVVNELNFNKLIRGGVLLVCIIIGIVDRKCSLGNHIFYDGLVAVAIVMFYQLFELPKVITVPLEYLGKHSMNIFLFHTFIFYYWFKSFIYSPRDPFLILCLLLGVCLLLSIFLEKVKQWIGFNKLLSKLK